MKANDGTYRALGGEGKHTLLTTNKISQYKWKSPRLTWLLTTFATILGRMSLLGFEAGGDQEAATRLKGAKEMLRRVHPIRNHFDTALASDDWVDDRRATPIPKITRKQDKKNQLLAQTGTLANANGSTPNFSTPKGQLPARAVTMSAGSRSSSVKRTAEAVAAEDFALIEQVKHAVKRARTERRPPKEAKQPPPHEHRYQTRSKSKSDTSMGSKRGQKKASQDVSMPDAVHNYGLRSKSKTEKSLPPPKAPSRTAKRPSKKPAPKQSEKRARPKKKHPNQNKRPM